MNDSCIRLLNQSCFYTMLSVWNHSQFYCRRGISNRWISLHIWEKYSLQTKGSSSARMLWFLSWVLKILDYFSWSYCWKLIVFIVHFQIGFCPQFDALLEFLIVQEHLELYAKIKGVSDYQIDDVCFHLKPVIFSVIATILCSILMSLSWLYCLVIHL